ncbi:MAG: hypothetical protein AW07_03456 [Candidatus Accumulibacter sp. SK-11]|nr:MAG: hypothetical protein AW07_03456 [Candidatus Accumulibacter sp. SK-11]
MPQVALHDEGIDAAVDLVARRGMPQPVRRSRIDQPGQIGLIGHYSVRRLTTYFFDDRVDRPIRERTADASEVQQQRFIRAAGGQGRAAGTLPI